MREPRSSQHNPWRRSPSSSSNTDPNLRANHHREDTESQRIRRSHSPYDSKHRDEDYDRRHHHIYHDKPHRLENRKSYRTVRKGSLSNNDLDSTGISHRHRSDHYDHNRSRDKRDYEHKSRRHRSRSKSPRDLHRQRRRSRQRSDSQPFSSRSRSRSSSRTRTYRHSHTHSRRKKRREAPSNQSPSPPPLPTVRSGRPLPSQAESYKGTTDVAVVNKDKDGEKQKPNYSTTGLLAREINAVSGTDIVLKYNEPPDARKPPSSQDWRLYIFKHSSLLQTIILRTRTCWLIGREIAVADIPVEHPSCSKQHAVIQFRHRATINEFGDKDAKVRPYLIDLESSNGTLLNGEKIEASRYFEIRNGDVVKFGFSEREFVVMLPPKDI